MNTLKKTILYTAGAIALSVSSFSASALTLSFDEDFIIHGTVINNQYKHLGVTIRADNKASDVVDRAIAFDTNFLYKTNDEDLRLDPSVYPNVGKVLVIQENNDCTATFCRDPDDEGSRPAGSLFFEFDKVINSLSFATLDIENQETSYVKLYDGSKTLVKTYSFADLDGAAFGDNVYSQVGKFSFGGLGVKTVEFALGGSGGIDDISVSPVPLPASLSIMLLGLFGLHFTRRRLLKRRG